jgi:hypothetical protein
VHETDASSTSPLTTSRRAQPEPEALSHTSSSALPRFEHDDRQPGESLVVGELLAAVVVLGARAQYLDEELRVGDRVRIVWIALE